MPDTRKGMVIVWFIASACIVAGASIQNLVIGSCGVCLFALIHFVNQDRA
jgi:hypothetical protein